MRTSPKPHLFSKISLSTANNFITRIFTNGPSYDQCLQRGQNNYDLLRLLAAAAVIIGHSYAISPKEGFIDPVARAIHFDYSGGLAVLLFFFLSGSLICDSYIRTPRPLRFICMRAARLLPGLAVCLLITVTVIGPYFTILDAFSYWTDPAASTYFRNNFSLTDLQWNLPGVFFGSSYGVNGSLWTLPAEVRLYTITLAIGLLGLLRNRWIGSLTIILLLAVMSRSESSYFLIASSIENRRLTYTFAVGALCALHKDRIPINGAIAIFTLALSIAFWNTTLKETAFYGCFIYVCLYLFQHPRVKRIKLRGDYSYGLYIYGFPAQQCIHSLLPQQSPWTNAAISLPIALTLGIVSWHSVESPVLRFTQRAGSFPFPTMIRAPIRFIQKGGLAGITILAIPIFAFSWPGIVSSREVKPAAISDLTIEIYGPNEVKAGQTFNEQPDGASAIWARASRSISPQADIMIGNQSLESAVNGNIITAVMPESLYSEPTTWQLYIRELDANGYKYSQPVEWKVVP